MASFGSQLIRDSEFQCSVGHIGQIQIYCKLFHSINLLSFRRILILFRFFYSINTGGFSLGYTHAHIRTHEHTRTHTHDKKKLNHEHQIYRRIQFERLKCFFSAFSLLHFWFALFFRVSLAVEFLENCSHNFSLLFFVCESAKVF